LPTGEHDPVVSRDRPTRERRCASATLFCAIAGYLAERRIPDLTSGFRAARREHQLEFCTSFPTDS
jgi:hypothetical protein